METPGQNMVSVVIVSWNAREYLLQCLNSLTSAACKYPMEIIVVDNASSDGSPEAVEKGYRQARVIRNSENFGFARANNVGIRASSGRYVCLINSDVKVLPDCITRLVDYLEQNQSVGMVGPRIIGADGKLQRSCRGFPGNWNMFCRTLALDKLFSHVRVFNGYSMLYWRQDTLRRVDILTGCFWAIRACALLEVGLLDEDFFMYGEDMDFCRRFRKSRWEVVFFPEAEAIHYGGASSSNAPVRFYIERHRADLAYWRKHHSWFSWGWFYGLCCLHQLLRICGYGLLVACQARPSTPIKPKIARSSACLKWLLQFHSDSNEVNL